MIKSFNAKYCIFHLVLETSNLVEFEGIPFIPFIKWLNPWFLIKELNFVNCITLFHVLLKYMKTINYRPWKERDQRSMANFCFFCINPIHKPIDEHVGKVTSQQAIKLNILKGSLKKSFN